MLGHGRTGIAAAGAVDQSGGLDQAAGPDAGPALEGVQRGGS